MYKKNEQYDFKLTYFIRWKSSFRAVLWIRIRIHRIDMFLGLLDQDTDPLVRGMDPDPDPSCKNSNKNLDSYGTILWLF